MRKAFITVCLVLLLGAGSAFAADVPITLSFAWNPNAEPDLAGYTLFHRVEGQSYDYTVPAKTIKLTDTGFNSASPETKLTFNIPDGQEVKNYFVMRAFDTSNNDSADSNEVWGDIDLRKPPAPQITASVYNDTTQTVDFTFIQSDMDLVDRWELYMSNTSGGTWTKINDLSKADPPVFSTSWQVPSDGNYFFTMVAFRNKLDTLSPDGKYITSINAGFSPNSNEVSAVVQVHPSPNTTFKVKMRVYQ